MNGRQHGKGMYISNAGQYREGIWKNGKRARWLDENDPNFS